MGIIISYFYNFKEIKLTLKQRLTITSLIVRFIRSDLSGCPRTVNIREPIFDIVMLTNAVK